MKQKFINAYMDVAERFAQLSSAKRLQVGAIVVKNDRIISIGYNGMPTGWDNCCENIVESMKDNPWHDYQSLKENGWEYQDECYVKLKTKSEVLHAESNAIAKLARSPESGEGATIFITHAPCIDCAKLIYQSGINSVYYAQSYRSEDGINFLKKSNIEVIKVERG
jgi:dCMP deaminase